MEAAINEVKVRVFIKLSFWRVSYVHETGEARSALRPTTRLPYAAHGPRARFPVYQLHKLRLDMAYPLDRPAEGAPEPPC